MAHDQTMTEAQRRMILFEIPGKHHARTSPESCSRANIKYLKLVMGLVEGPLHQIYGKKMSAEVGIITPYSHQRYLYELEMQKLRDKGWSDESLPQVLSIEGTRGRYFNHAILDEVDCLASEDEEGFRYSENHACAFFTRAIKAMWIVGGTPPDSASTDAPETDSEEERTAKGACLFYSRSLAEKKCVVPRDGEEVDELEWPVEFRVADK